MCERMHGTAERNELTFSRAIASNVGSMNLQLLVNSARKVIDEQSDLRDDAEGCFQRRSGIVGTHLHETYQRLPLPMLVSSHIASAATHAPKVINTPPLWLIRRERNAIIRFANTYHAESEWPITLAYWRMFMSHLDDMLAGAHSRIHTRQVNQLQVIFNKPTTGRQENEAYP